MKIGIEVGWGQKTGGARTVAYSILTHLPRLAPEDQFFLFCNTPHPEYEAANVLDVPLPAPRPLPQVIYDQFVFPHYSMPLAAAAAGVEVLHYTNNYISIRPPAATVVTVHDLTPFVIPETYRPIHLKYQQWYIRRAVRQADYVVTDSDSSRRDLMEILDADPSRLVVVPCAVDHDHFLPITDRKRLEALKAKYRLPEKFVLFVGTLAPRKNVDKILLALASLRHSRRMALPLVIAGRSDFQDPGLEGIVRKEGLSDSVIFTGTVPFTDLPALYSMATVFAYPSLYEGFGLPVLEAMACGAPTITSNVSSLPEVAGEAALTVAPADIEALARGIGEIWDDENLREALKTRGFAQAGLFSWERAATEYLSVYHRAADSRG